MTKMQYLRMTTELKQAFKQLFRDGHLDGIARILEKYHPRGKRATTEAQIMIAGEFIRSIRKRGELVPLGSLSTSTDLRGRYAGIGFGVIPDNSPSVQLRMGKAVLAPKGTRRNSR